VAKDLIVNEVRAIQENVVAQTTSGSDSDQLDPYGTKIKDDHSVGGILRPPPRQVTPQLPSTVEGSLVEPLLVPIEEQL